MKETEKVKKTEVMALAKKPNSLVISPEEAGQRIDNFLLRKLKNIPKSRIYKMVRKGEVRVNSKRIKPEYKINSGDLIRIPPLWKHKELKYKDKGERHKVCPPKNAAQSLLNSIIFEDDNLIVLNKPEGMAAHGGSGINFGVIEMMRLIRPDLRYLELVHRLDRGTSGCLLLAKKRSVLRLLHGLLREGKVRKTYLLLVKGKWQGGVKNVDAPLLKNRLSSGERMVKVGKSGKDALTIFRPVFTAKKASLIEAELRTGKTHQIRVHAAYLGFPIAGDEKYGDREFNKILRDLGLKRLFLHAKEISFRLQEGEEVLHFVAPLDEKLDMVLQKLNCEDK